MAIDVLWNDIEVVANDRRYIALQPQLHLLLESVRPSELAVELAVPTGFLFGR